MTPEQLDGFVQAGSPQLSPDGRHVAYVVTSIDLAENMYRSRIWVVPSDASAPPRPLSAGEHNDSQPRWSPDGSTLAFTSTRKVDTHGKKESTLHLLPFDHPGETALVHTSKEAMTGLTFSPDGRWLAFAMRARSSDYEVDDPSRREPRKIQQLMFTLNGEGFISDRPSHIHVAALDGSGVVRDLTSDERECNHPTWFPDSTTIAFHLDPRAPRDTHVIATVDLDGNVERISDPAAVATTPVVSPDGATIAVAGFDDPETLFQNAFVGMLDVGTVSTPRWITEVVDRNWLPMTAGGPTWDDTGLRAAIEDRGDVHLYEIDPGGDAEPTLVVGGTRSVTGWSSGVIDGRPAIAFAATDGTTPSEIVVLVDGEERRLTSVSSAWTAVVKPVEPEHFLVPSGDVEVDAWIVRPKDFDPSKRYPMLLNIHGGPFAQYGNVFFDEFQMQSRAGYVAVYSNPRGGSGRTTEWAASIRGPKHKVPGAGWGTLDFDDVMAVVDTALDRFDFIDPDRLGVLGGSYGGYLTSWIVTRTNRFAAACSERAANNLLSLEFGSDIAGFFHAEMGPRHFDDAEEYLRMSPVSYVRDIETPLLIVHSEEDLRCPTEQATQLFVALTLLEKDVEYWLFPAETHELSRSGSPVHRKRRAEIILEYFDRKLAVAD